MVLSLQAQKDLLEGSKVERSAVSLNDGRVFREGSRFELQAESFRSGFLCEAYSTFLSHGFDVATTSQVTGILFSGMTS